MGESTAVLDTNPIVIRPWETQVLFTRETLAKFAYAMNHSRKIKQQRTNRTGDFFFSEQSLRDTDVTVVVGGPQSIPSDSVTCGAPANMGCEVAVHVWRKIPFAVRAGKVEKHLGVTQANK